MGIREVLQTEIWSKETSRKILARLRKILRGLKYVAYGLGVLVVLFLIFSFVWTHWLTTKERSADRIALAQLDALEKLDGVSDTEFDLQDKQAKEKVQIADQTAFTAKDILVANDLVSYLILRESLRSERTFYDTLDARFGPTRSQHLKESTLKTEEENREEIRYFKKTLHELLDK
jgi:hypothetical protein